MGTQLAGRYRLDEVVGTGGMATVYRAYDRVLEREVAIKLTLRELSEDSEVVGRLNREAQAVAQLNHPHIVSVINVDEEGGRPFIVFEYVRGETLKQRIRRYGQLPIAEAVEFTTQIAQALGGAHAQRIVHRDVKPQNVLLDEEGIAKVTDFGIARTLNEEGLTIGGRVFATTDYISPEQALGRPVNPQSDLYSLGVVLFEMLTGRVPFFGESEVTVARKHVKQPLPDVQSLRLDTPACVSLIVDKLCAKDTAQRYSDTTVLIRDLSEASSLLRARRTRFTTNTSRNCSSNPPAFHPTISATKTTHSSAPKRGIKTPVLTTLVAALLVAATVLTVVSLRLQRSTPSHALIGRSAQTRPISGVTAQNYSPRIAGQSDSPLVKPPIASTLAAHGEGTLTTGTGVALSTNTAVVASELEIKTPVPGFEVQIYAAADDLPVKLASSNWVRIGGGNVTHRRTRFILATKQRPYRHYMVWVTRVKVGGAAKITQLHLYRTSL